MGWIWSDEPDGLSSSVCALSDYQSPNPSSDGDRCSTRKVVRSQCKTEEVEPGKFIRKCNKTEEILRDCVGRSVEVVESNREYSEEDVTDEVLKGSLSVESGVFDFPGLRSDIDAIERSLFDGLSRFFGAAEEMKDGFFNAFGGPHVFGGESSSSPAFRRRTGVPFDNHPQPHEPKNPESDSDSGGNIDLSGLARDV
ncbi:hypothetical protein FNV43_RR16693 [Rhamnella rubrinervis]|uniref:Mal d 1-associated protein n=1 Tax=Rhamnella rubrinervis TaxID=2594499 RepID=A0A8K0MDN0_9ROSA|nr:hypothetical protein FNV43_RR16693 [Rhamnella rubrinervis]